MKPIEYDDVHALLAEGSLREVIGAACREAAEASAARRALILRHPDIAERLTQQPLNFTTPQHWNGSVPPELWNQVRNDSPRRPVLLEMVAEANRRESRQPATCSVDPRSAPARPDPPPGVGG
jgi:hypothetical protein